MNCEEMWRFVDLLANERQYKIQQLLQKNGAVSTSNLVSQLDVSVETIRRDFLAMEQQGLLKRVHGGAVSASSMKSYLELSQRNKEHNDQKRELAAYAIRFVSEGDYIALDTGSTAIFLAEALRDNFSRLTVVTHSLDALEILRENPGISVVLCGGHYMREENSFYGSPTIEAYQRFHCRKSFIFPSAISLEYGIGDFQQDLFLIQKELLTASDQVFILADSSKFEQKAFLKLDEMRKEYCYITDSLLPEDLKKLYLENDIQIYNQ